jgi:SAM-dependent methyltransferase
MPSPAAARQPERPDGWFATPLAQRLLRAEQLQSIPRLTSSYGRTGLYLRCAATAPEELSGNMLHRVLRVYRAAHGLDGDLRCVDGELPLLRESVDLVYLLHAFDGGAAPHDLLLEIDRVLAPEGQLMLVGLNPWSPWRLRWIGAGLRPRSAASQSALLGEAGFEVIARQGLGPWLPWLREREAIPSGARRDPCSALRAGYLIHARKRRRGITPLRTRAVALQPGIPG